MSAKVTSPLGTREFASTNFKEFDIPDENPMSDYENHYAQHRSNNPQERAREHHASSTMQPQRDFSEEERQIREAHELREAKRLGKERMPDAARKRIELLINMSKLYRHVTLDGNEYLLQTLSTKDLRDVYIESSKFDGTVEFPYEIRRQILSRSLVQIAGQDVGLFLNSNSLEVKLDFLDMLPENFAGRLFDEYNVLAKEANDKYSIKTKEDAKEVIEDLKK